MVEGLLCGVKRRAKYASGWMIRIMHLSTLKWGGRELHESKEGRGDFLGEQSEMLCFVI